MQSDTRANTARRRPIGAELLAAAAVLFLPVVLFGLLLALNALNPLQVGFIEGFEVVNDSGETVSVTPIGVWERTGEYGPLPLYRSKFPAIPQLRGPAQRQLAPNTSCRFLYDCDDINFRHILVQTTAGDVFIVDSDKRGSLNACYGPQRSRYRVPPLAELARAPNGLRPCLHGKSVAYSGCKQYP